MTKLKKILMIDSITDEIAELIAHLDNAKSKALKDRLQKELETKRVVLADLKSSLADDIVESTLYSSDDDDRCDFCCPCDDFEDDEEEGDVALLRKVARIINDAADCIEENGKVKVTVD